MPETWSASERRVIEPFCTAPNALNGCGFRASQLYEFAYSNEHVSRILVEPEELRSGLSPDFHLAILATDVCQEVSIPADCIGLSVLIRDTVLRRYERVTTWSIDELPEYWRLPTGGLSKFGLSRRLDFALALSPLMVTEERFRVAWRPGDTVSSKIFSVITESEGITFPIEFVRPEFFSSKGLSKKTTWIVDWKVTSGDFDLPPEEVLTIYATSTCKDKLARISSADSIGQIFGRELASEICAEIACFAFRRCDNTEPDHPEGLLNAITKKFGTATGAEFDYFLQVARADEDRARSYFRSYAQELYGLNDTINKAVLTGRR